MTATKKRGLPDGWMSKQGRIWLRRQASRARRIVEVGCWLGRSTSVLARWTKGTVWAVDHWLGAPADAAQHDRLYAPLLEERDPYAEFCVNLRRYIRIGKVIPLKMTSIQAADFLGKQHGRAIFDFVFIDADHRYETCAADIAAYLPLVRSGGLIAGHDYSDNWPGVQRAVGEAFTAFGVGPGSIWHAHV